MRRLVANRIQYRFYGTSKLFQPCWNQPARPSRMARSFTTKRQQRASNHQNETLNQQADSNRGNSATVPLDTEKAALSLDRHRQQHIVLPSHEKIELQNDFNVDFHSHSSSIYTLDQAREIYQPDLHMASAPTDWTGYEEATPLSDSLTAWIGVTGRPISVAEYMRLALTHPDHGYYSKGFATNDSDDDFDRDDFEESNTAQEYVIGGDFITAPEISQVFGECLGVWYYTQWQQQQQKDWQWLECGPGKGTLTVDVLEFARIDAEFLQSCRAIHFVESSPVLQKLQQESLVAWKQKSGVDISFEFHHAEPSLDEKRKAAFSKAINVYWHPSWQEYKQHAEPRSTFAVCQEFLDALPVYAFEKTDDGWRERLVDVAVREDFFEDESASAKKSNAIPVEKSRKPRLRIVLSPEVTAPLKTLLRTDDNGHIENDAAETGNVIEVSPESILFAQDLAKEIEQNGGAALMIDYGQVGSADTIRGFSQHKQVHFLSQPGLVDVTVDVDFGAIRHQVGSNQAYGPVGQGQFLITMGLQERVLQVIESDDCTDEHAENIYNAMVRLASPDQMGERYKVMGIVPTGSETPAGF